jgi:aminoglycoside phosphotransferase family enzyme/predicted kinase
MNPLISGLLDPAAYPHPARAPRLIETHISWVILAGDYAYKLKKPLDLGFLDFSTLEKREHYCHEEIRLNSRLAPATYLDVVAITGTPEQPRIGGVGTVLEWAVKMRAFPADATLDREAEISAEQIDAIADRVARFHGEIAVAPAQGGFGSLAAVQAPVAENFAQLRARLVTADARLAHLEAWSQAEGQRLAGHFTARRRDGFIRECHGDLHLGNIAWVNNAPLIFDGIEFNPGLRYIDVISEIAFFCMDLAHRGKTQLAWRFLNRYLEHSGDYAGLSALPYYQTYRALVRAKVSAILATSRASQSGADFSEALSYLELAERFTRRPAPALLLMQGVSGSGKTWVSQHLLERLSAYAPTVRLRSDVERKRLFGLDALADSRSLGENIYSREASERTLARLLDLAKTLLDSGFRVIVDATFIKQDWREPFHRLAEELALPWWIAALEAPSGVLRQRLLARRAGGRDASEAGLEVLSAQLAGVDPFSADELPHVVRLSGEPDQAVSQIKALLP